MILSEIQATLPLLGPIRYSTLGTAAITFVLVTYLTRRKGTRAFYYGATSVIIWAAWYETILVGAGYVFAGWRWMELWPFLALAGWCVLGLERAFKLGFDRLSASLYLAYLFGLVVWVGAFGFRANYVPTETVDWSLESLNVFTKSALPLAFALQHRNTSSQREGAGAPLYNH